MSITELNSILIVEPNQVLTSPYIYLPPFIKTKRTTSLDHTLRALSQLNPDIIFLSCSFSHPIMLRLLEAFKVKSRKKIIPIILIANQQDGWSQVIGTSWGGKMGIISTEDTPQAISLEIERVLNA